LVITGQLKDVVNKQIKWLWKPFIPFGKVTMIQGDTGIGKTHVLIKIMADISNGLYPPTMKADHLLPQVEGEPVKIYYVSVENGIDDTIAPVFDQFGGNRENVLYQDETQGHFVLNWDEIREVVEKTGAKVIVIDPWQQFLDDMTSSNNIGVREMIGEIQNAADETGAAVIFTGNFTKGGGSNEAQRGIGGAELSNTLRCILTVTRSELGPYIRTVRATKMSLPGKEMTPVAVQMVDEDMRFVDYLDLRDTLQDAPKEVRELNQAFPEVGVSEEAEEDEPVAEVRPKSAVDKAVEFLKGVLMEGPMESNEVKRRAAELGISESSLSRAKKRAHVVYQKNGDGSAYWKIDYAM
jgi:RecA-family ATPase